MVCTGLSTSAHSSIYYYTRPSPGFSTQKHTIKKGRSRTMELMRINRVINNTKKPQ